jgi:hypothetical protein
MAFHVAGGAKRHRNHAGTAARHACHRRPMQALQERLHAQRGTFHANGTKLPENRRHESDISAGAAVPRPLPPVFLPWPGRPDDGRARCHGLAASSLSSLPGQAGISHPPTARHDRRFTWSGGLGRATAPASPLLDCDFHCCRRAVAGPAGDWPGQRWSRLCRTPKLCRRPKGMAGATMLIGPGPQPPHRPGPTPVTSAAGGRRQEPGHPSPVRCGRLAAWPCRLRG